MLVQQAVGSGVCEAGSTLASELHDLHHEYDKLLGGPDGAGEEWLLDAGEVARVLSNVAVCFVRADSLARAVAVAKAAGAVDPSEGKPKEVLRVAEQLLEWEAQGGTLEEGMARLASEG